MCYTAKVFSGTRFFKAFFLFLFSAGGLSAKAVLVHRIAVKGNRLIETPLIQSHIRLRAGKPYRPAIVREDVRRLFSLGFFDEVEVHTHPAPAGRRAVTYTVKERPVIYSIEFKGNENLSEEELKELLTLKEFHFLNFDRLKETFSAIRKKYQEKGWFFVKVSYRTLPLKKKKGVKLILQIEENTKALVKKINFIGNRSLSSETLKSYLMTREQSLFSFFGASGAYNPELLDRDRQVIEFLYRDRGWLQIRLEKPEVSLSPDGKGVYITLSVTEGPRFKTGEVRFEGDPPVTSEQVRDHLTLGKKKGEYFSLSALRADLDFITRLYKDKGHAFARVEPQIFPDNIEENRVHVILRAEKGNLYKLGRIEISGNHKTRDKVILRHFNLEEGSLYSESEKRRARALIQRLGFFETVDLEVKKRTKATADIHVKLKERENTGEATLAAGYNSYSRWLIKGGLKTDNFMGMGHSFSAQVDLGQFQELLNFNYTNPWFQDSDWSLGVDLFNVGRDAIGSSSFFLSPDQYGLFYSQLNTGASVSVGRNFSDSFSVFLKYTFKRQQVVDDFAFFIRKLPLIKPVYEFLFGKPNRELLRDKRGAFLDIYPPEQADGLNSLIKGTLQYDRRDDRFRPSGGWLGSFSLEYSGRPGDFNYTKAVAAFSHYQKLFWGLVLKNNLNFGLTASNDKDRPVPFTELFLLGGSGSLKGFRAYGVGKRKYSGKALDYARRRGLPNPEEFAYRPFGGSRMFYYNLELRVPLLKRMYLDGILFFDMGQAGDSLTFALSDRPEEGFGLRLDAGFGLQAQLPMLGLVRLDWGFPFKFYEEYGERPMEFQITMGAGF